MMSLPQIPSWDSLHPLIVHFPVALLAVTPLFIVLGIVMRRNGEAFSLAALALLALGTAAAFLAVETGEAASELVARTPEISRVLQHHSELAYSTLRVFLALAVLFASVLLVPRLLKKEPRSLTARSLQVIVLFLYAAGILNLVNTAHQGGVLVHGLGVHAMMGSSNAQP